ncbi:class I SAM-dependent methyltransferase [Ideonella sp. 4Y16]|uniref:SAM-dependent methyltransferase n=1 Tax=Ideonella alba TaxID=2824118 RepID=UPI001B35E9A6|nr:class I SAM-dependent methyltransferase [Ideonella alba]MBQ0943537.1 class I SAM-dependent methyltransferase [Ideonella alba]
MKDQWNDRFAAPGHKYGTEPNAFLRRQAALLAPHSQVLVPGDGEGRNGVWLATQGHQVLALDYAENGLAKARALAAERGVARRYEARWADLSAWTPPEQRFDALVLVYCHLPSAVRRVAHAQLAGLLSPGGWCIVEGFHPGQLQGYTSGGPKDPDMLLTLADLRAEMGDVLDEIEAFEGEVPLFEGTGHQGPGFVTRWVARRR